MTKLNNIDFSNVSWSRFGFSIQTVVCESLCCEISCLPSGRPSKICSTNLVLQCKGSELKYDCRLLILCSVISYQPHVVLLEGNRSLPMKNQSAFDVWPLNGVVIKPSHTPPTCRNIIMAKRRNGKTNKCLAKSERLKVSFRNETLTQHGGWVR